MKYIRLATMEETEKPFACTFRDCNMKFTNDDHLNSHQQKHIMNLNIEAAEKSGIETGKSDSPCRRFKQQIQYLFSF